MKRGVAMQVAFVSGGIAIVDKANLLGGYC
jgi:hypothetical protein